MVAFPSTDNSRQQNLLIRETPSICEWTIPLIYCPSQLWLVGIKTSKLGTPALTQGAKKRWKLGASFYIKLYNHIKAPRAKGHTVKFTHNSKGRETVLNHPLTCHDSTNGKEHVIQWDNFCYIIELHCLVQEPGERKPVHHKVKSVTADTLRQPSLNWCPPDTFKCNSHNFPTQWSKVSTPGKGRLTKATMASVST